MNLSGIGTQLTSNLYSAGGAQSQQMSARSHAGTSSQGLDSISLSGQGLLISRLQSLQASDPAKFKEVLTQAAGQLQAAARQEGDTPRGQALSELATKFQNVANGGDLSQLKPATYSNRVQQAYGRHQVGGAQELLSAINPTRSATPSSGTDPHYVLKSVLNNLNKV
jgi:hypothetical protein